MRPKLAIPVLLIGLAAAPAAAVANQNRVHLYAFSTEGRAFAAAARIGTNELDRLTSEREQRIVLLAPTVVAAVRPAPARASLKDERPTVCGEWRALMAGPRARAANLPMVRPCEGPMREIGGERPPMTVALPERQASAPEAPWFYTVDLGALQ